MMHQFYLVSIFLTSLLAACSAQVTATLYEGNLEDIAFLPREREVQYAPLQGIHNLTYNNVMAEYTRVLECIQLVESLSAEMAKRLNSSVPPPHHHCFIWEKNLSNIHALTHNTTQGLRCDQHMLARFPPALERAAMFESLHFLNQETRVIFKVKNIVENILSVLSNFTGVNVTETSFMAAGDVEACGAPPTRAEQEEEEEEEEDDLTENRDVSFHREASESLSEERSGSQRPSNPNAAPGTSSRAPLQLQAASDTTPTSATPTMCRSIDSAEEQFIYITELRFALFYLKLDLKQHSYCL